MPEFACSACRQVLRSRLRRRLLHLQDGRRSLHSSSILKSERHNRTVESWYWETKPPTLRELAAAEHFFRYNRPFRQWTGETWRQDGAKRGPLQIPEVIFLGRSNVGKSSTINALAGEDLNRVSAVPGATKAMAAWAFAAKTPSGGAIAGWDGDVSTKLSLVDMPGYGFGSKALWGSSIMTYLIERKHIRRAFILLDTIHGIQEGDRHLIEILRGLAIPYQIVATKCDRLVEMKDYEGQVREALTTLRTQAQFDTTEEQKLALGEIICMGNLHASILKGKPPPKSKDIPFGVQNLQWAVLRAVGLDTYAVQKAQGQGALKNIATEEQPSMRIDYVPGVDLSPKTADPITIEEKPMPSETAGTKSSSSSSSLPDLSIEEFMREIMGARATPSAMPPTPPTPTKSTTDTDALPPWERLMQGYRNREQSRVQRQIPLRQPAYRSGLEGPEGGRYHPQQAVSSRSRLPPSLRFPEIPLRRAAPTAPTTTSTAAQPTRSAPPNTSSEGKVVLRGSDAFEAMMGSSEPAKSTSRTRGKQKKNKSKSGSKQAVQEPSRAQSARPALSGKGVLRGMDAFESMFSEPPRTKSAAKRRRRSG
ncbi:ribosome biogenesis GTP-binding protein YsxC [Exophiala oligosperma]|uniref:Ribosome biogenesis GTP-binding protein YsxC n=1 Tax=Exophiala oligosperma TaxID=215243 RepID=A0A0D2E000_9EURO|nr:ribosome biogenesis GTP-binding protein YsxC [Exophiala oligosperma]KIW41109.1 ribosome biogenesis GTP-binding protein YsxC [Exophiala oligosperma]